MGPKTHAKVVLASGSPRRKELLTSLGIEFAVCVSDVDETLEAHWTPAEAVEQLARRKARAVADQLLRRRFGQAVPTVSPAEGPAPAGSECAGTDFRGLLPHGSMSPAAETDNSTAPSDAAASPGPVLVIAADTIVVLDGEIMGKPADEEDAARMLRRLSGRRHEVYSGLSIFCVDGSTAAKPVDASPAGSDAASVCIGDSGRYYVVSKASDGKPEILVGHTVSKVTFGPMTDDEIAAYIKTGEPLDKAGAYGIQGYGAVFIEKIEGDFFSIMGLPLNLLYRMFVELGMRPFMRQ